jgi:hypothetical protein
MTSRGTLCHCICHICLSRQWKQSTQMIWTVLAAAELLTGSPCQAGQRWEVTCMVKVVSSSSAKEEGTNEKTLATTTDTTWLILSGEEPENVLARLCLRLFTYRRRIFMIKRLNTVNFVIFLSFLNLCSPNKAPGRGQTPMVMSNLWNILSYSEYVMIPQKSSHSKCNIPSLKQFLVICNFWSLAMISTVQQRLKWTLDLEAVRTACYWAEFSYKSMQDVIPNSDLPFA